MTRLKEGIESLVGKARSRSPSFIPFLQYFLATSYNFICILKAGPRQRAREANGFTVFVTQISGTASWQGW